MPESISHAEIVALHFAIQLAEAEGYAECAAGLRTALAHLERTQPPDTQADLTERARVHATVKQLMHDGCWRCNFPTCVTGPFGSASCWGRHGKLIARVIQSEREAAAAEARRAALTMLECHRDLVRYATMSSPSSDETHVSTERMRALDRAADDLRHVLASPAPKARRVATVAEQIGAEIVSIMETHDQQEAERGYVDTPGGLEHMGDVWRLLGRWRDRLASPAPQEPSQ